MATLRRGRSSSSIVVAVVATVLALGLLYLIVKTAVGAINPLFAAQYPPRDQAPLLRFAVFETLRPDASISDAKAQQARRVAVASPLAFEPFYILARRAEMEGRLEDATTLMEEARKRRPNFAATRLQLAAYYTRSERLEELLAELEIILKLRPEAIEPVMGELAKMMRTPGGRSALATALGRDPHWKEQFFSIARGQGVRPDNAIALLQEMQKRNPSGAHLLERRMVIFALFDSGQVRRARQMWLAELPERERKQHELLVNRSFQGTPLPPPFGWSMRTTESGRAEIQPHPTTPYLDVNYFGGTNEILAEQVIALPPGGYQLRFVVGGEIAGDTSALSWTINCAGSNRELVRMDISGVSNATQRRASAFAVPGADCDGQYLRLRATAGDVPAPVHLKFSGLEIVR